jgi:hypothetical protein
MGSTMFLRYLGATHLDCPQLTLFMFVLVDLPAAASSIYDIFNEIDGSSYCPPWKRIS